MPEPKKLRRSDYFPKEPTNYLLSEVLAYIARVSYIDRLLVS
jgi:hypothetical protein